MQPSREIQSEVHEPFFPHPYRFQRVRQADHKTKDLQALMHSVQLSYPCEIGPLMNVAMKLPQLEKRAWLILNNPT
jgi:hypothetical protein